MMALALAAVLSCGAERLTTPSGASATTRHASTESRLAHPSSVLLLVTVAPGISNGVVRGALNEATAIWRDAGVMIAWHLSDGSSIDGDPSTVRVLLDDARGSVSGQDLPLGWINFNASGRSEGIVIFRTETSSNCSTRLRPIAVDRPLIRNCWRRGRSVERWRMN